MQNAFENAVMIAFDRTSVTRNHRELVYIMLNLTALSNQLARYDLVEVDVSASIQSVAEAKTFVLPTESA